MRHQPRNDRKTTHNVLTNNMGAHFRKIGQETIDGRLIGRLSSDYFLHGVSEDMKYDMQRSVKANRDTKKAQQPEQTNVNFAEVVSDLELIDIVEIEWHDDTRDVVFHTVQQNARYKVYLKDLVLDDIPDVHFSRPTDKTKLEQVVSAKLKQHMILSVCTANELKEDLKVGYLEEQQKSCARTLQHLQLGNIRGASMTISHTLY